MRKRLFLGENVVEANELAVGGERGSLALDIDDDRVRRGHEALVLFGGKNRFEIVEAVEAADAVALFTQAGGDLGFHTVEDGITACTELYARFYKDLSASALVSRWTDGGGNAAYRAQVASCY